MRDEELARALAELAPIRDQQVEALDLADAEAELIEAVVASPGVVDSSGLERRHGARRAWRTTPVRVGALLTAAATVAVLVLLGIGSGGDPSKPQFAAAAIRVAQANPRLLVTLPGWEVVRADEFEVDSGEMAFSDGEHQLTVTWYPARYYESYYRDRTWVDKDPTTFELLGQDTRTVAYSDREFATMLPPDGEVFVELRADLAYDDYRELVESLQPADVETWLSAMPPSVVQPTDRAATVDTMLEDVPLPPSIDVASLENDESVLSRYQLGARVTGAVACAWLDRWVKATDSGDRADAQEAGDAMATSRQWAILQEMTKEGAWSQVLWEYADAIGTGTQRGTGGLEQVADDTRQFRISYSSGLGC